MLGFLSSPRMPLNCREVTCPVSPPPRVLAVKCLPFCQLLCENPVPGTCHGGWGGWGGEGPSVSSPCPLPAPLLQPGLLAHSRDSSGWPVSPPQ